MKKEPVIQNREARIYRGCLILLPVLALFVFLSCQGYSIPAQLLPPCLFHTLTGFSCPGCGCTRAVIALAKGELLASLCYNPGILYCVVLYLLFVLSHTAAYISAMIIKKLPSRLQEPLQREKSLLHLLNRIHGMKAKPMYLYALIWLFLGFGVLRFSVELWQRFH